MKSFTPGPWEVVDTTVYAEKKTENGMYNIFYATVTTFEKCDTPKEELEANARLIACAPDLLEALQAITDLYDTDEGCRSLPEYVNARAAIAKALGKA